MERVMNRLQNIKSNIATSKVFLKSKQLCNVLWTTFCEFCESSSINGVRYITERRLHWSERILWLIAIGISLWMSSILIIDTWQAWRDNLTTLNAEENGLISEIPFPTVTICPMIKSTRDKFDLQSLYSDTRALDISRLSAKDNARLHALAHICWNLKVLTFQDNYNNDSIYDIIEDVAPKLEHTLDDCRWRGKRFDCSKYFVPVFTYFGFCFTFNTLNSIDDYTDAMAPTLMRIKNNPNVSSFEQESGFTDTSTENLYPMRTDEPGPKGGLTVSLVSHKKDYTARCIPNEKDFMLMLSSPGESSETYQTEYRMPISSTFVVSMEPELTTTSDALRSYSQIERGCTYSTERQLAFFKSYSLPNCGTECLSNFTLERCGCVPFYLPRFVETKICGAAKLDCYYKALLHVQPSFGKCNCLPACSSVNYFAKYDVVTFNQLALSEFKAAHRNYSELQTIELSIFFKDLQLKKIKRMETTTFADFLSVCGGLLGLFLGITALSIIEIVYYLTLRLFWNVRNSIKSEDLSSNHSNDELATEAWTCKSTVKLKHAIQKISIEFCDNGCLHGVQYLSEKGLYWIERFCWMVAIIISFGVCCFLTRNIWVEWSENPTTMIRSEIGLNELAYRRIPYPTITVCPETKTLIQQFDLSSALRNELNLSDVDKNRLKALAHICPRLADRLEYDDEYIDESIFDTIANMSMKVSDSIISAMSFLSTRNYKNYFVPVLTDEGLCFTYNALNSHEIFTDSMAPGMMIVQNNPSISGWSLDSGFAHGRRENVYPRRYIRDFFYIAFKINKNDDNQCKYIDEGLKVILTAPGDSLKMSRNYFRVPLAKDTTLSISIKLFTTSEGLRHYTPSQRQCFYSDERQLKFFKNYTQHNCEAECLANFTRMECGCVKFSMPRDRDTKICGNPNIICYRSAEKKLTIDESAEYYRSKCNCLPGCTSIEYNAYSERQSVDQTHFKKFYESPKNVITHLHFIQTNSIKLVHRKDTYTWIDFLANVGGLLGLFLGISALSIIELVYYSTLRLFWTYCRLRSEANEHIQPPNREIITVETIEAIENLSLHSSIDEEHVDSIENENKMHSA